MRGLFVANLQNLVAYFCFKKIRFTHFSHLGIFLKFRGISFNNVKNARFNDKFYCEYTIIGEILLLI